MKNILLSFFILVCCAFIQQAFAGCLPGQSYFEVQINGDNFMVADNTTFEVVVGGVVVYTGSAPDNVTTLVYSGCGAEGAAISVNLISDAYGDGWTSNPPFFIIVGCSQVVSGPAGTIGDDPWTMQANSGTIWSSILPSDNDGIGAINGAAGDALPACAGNADWSVQATAADAAAAVTALSAVPFPAGYTKQPFCDVAGGDDTGGNGPSPGQTEFFEVCSEFTQPNVTGNETAALIGIGTGTLELFNSIDVDGNGGGNDCGGGVVGLDVYDSGGTLVSTGTADVTGLTPGDTYCVCMTGYATNVDLAGPDMMIGTADDGVSPADGTCLLDGLYATIQPYESDAPCPEQDFTVDTDACSGATVNWTAGANCEIVGPPGPVTGFVVDLFIYDANDDGIPDVGGAPVGYETSIDVSSPTHTTGSSVPATQITVKNPALTDAGFNFTCAAPPAVTLPVNQTCAPITYSYFLVVFDYANETDADGACGNTFVPVNCREYAPNCTAERYDIVVWPAALSTVVTNDGTTCGTPTVELRDAAGNVCETLTGSACSINGDAFNYDFGATATATALAGAPVGCVLPTLTGTITCAGCVCPEQDFTVDTDACSGATVNWTAGANCEIVGPPGPVTGFVVDLFIYDANDDGIPDVGGAPVGYETSIDVSSPTHTTGLSVPATHITVKNPALTDAGFDFTCAAPPAVTLPVNQTCAPITYSYFLVVFDYANETDGDGDCGGNNCTEYAPNCTAERYDIVVYPAPLTVVTTGDAACGTLTAELQAADGTVCETATAVTCAADGDVLNYDFSASATVTALAAAPAACLPTGLTGTLTCAACCVPAFNANFTYTITNDTLVSFLPDFIDTTLDYFWNFGNGNSTTTQQPTEDFDFGKWEVCLTVNDPCSTYTYCDSLFIYDPCAYVAPGDVYHDGTVDLYDLLIGGFAMEGATGPPREPQYQTTVFDLYPASEWNATLSTICNNIDLSHADANGNGIIEINDLQVIVDNFGQSISYNNCSEQPVICSAVDTTRLAEICPFIDLIDGTTFNSTDTINIQQIINAQTLYSYKTEVELVVGSVTYSVINISEDFTTSPLGTENVNLFGFGVYDSPTTTQNIGATRLDLNNILVQGYLGSSIVCITDIDQLRYSTTDPGTTLSFPVTVKIKNSSVLDYKQQDLSTFKEVIEVPTIDCELTFWLEPIPIDSCENLSASIVSATDETCDGTSGTITVNVSGGVPPYNGYIVENGTFPPTTYPMVSFNNGTSTTNIEAGNYTFVVFDSQNCQAACDSSFFSIGENPGNFDVQELYWDLTCPEDNQFCDGRISLFAFGGVPPYTYIWEDTSLSGVDASGLCLGIYNITISDLLGCQKVINVNIEEPESMTLGYDGLTNAVCNENNGSIILVPQGGIAPYTYYITNLYTSNSNQNNSGVFANLDPGQYIAQFTDSNGCFYQCPVGFFIELDTTIIEVNISSALPLCFNDCNGTATLNVLSGTPPFTYLWSDGSTEVSQNNLCQGIYYITVSDSNGCTSEQIINLTQPDELVVSTSLLGNTSCYGLADGSALAQANGGTPPYFYNWDNGETTATATNLSGGLNYVTITDVNGCTTVSSGQVGAPPELGGIINDLQNVSCTGANDGSFNVTPFGGNGPLYTYFLNGTYIGTQDTITGLAAGTYILGICDGRLCYTESTIYITEPDPLNVSVTSTNISCYNVLDGEISSTTTGGTAPYSYTLQSAVDTLIHANPSFTGLEEGIYTYIVEDANRCISTHNITIEEPLEMTMTISVIDVDCPGGGDGATIPQVSNGIAPLTYVLNGTLTQQNPYFVNLSGGIYEIAIIDANGCVITDSVKVDEPAPITIEVNYINHACFGQYNGSVDVIATTNSTVGIPFLYSINGFDWTLSSTGVTFDNLQAGDHTIQVSDSSGRCEIDTIITVLNAYPSLGIDVIDVQPSCFSTPQGSAEVSAFGGIGPYEYRLYSNPIWDSSGVFNNLASGTYPVWVRDLGGGCDSLSTAGFTITALSCFGINIHPNPAYKYTTVDYNFGDSPVDMIVFDLLGRKMVVKENLKGKASIRISLTNWSFGTYLFHFRDKAGNTIETKRLIMANF